MPGDMPLSLFNKKAGTVFVTAFLLAIENHPTSKNYLKIASRKK